MLKKILLFVICSLTINTFAQNCIPDTSITVPGIYPDQLGVAIANSPYEFTLQILSLEDTIVEFQGQTITASIDSVQLDSVVGLPDGFTFGCEPGNCLFDYTAVGCIKLSGNPVLADTGFYPLSIYTTAYARWFALRLPVPDTIDRYTLVIADGVASVQDYSEEVIIYPNPALGNSFQVRSSVPISKMKLLNMEGKVVLEERHSNLLKVNILTSGVPSGVYVLKLETLNGIISKRIVL